MAALTKNTSSELDRKRKVLLSAKLQEIEKLVNNSESLEVIKTLEDFVNRRKDAKLSEENHAEELSVEVLRECKKLLILAKKRNDSGLKMETLVILKKVAEMMPDFLPQRMTLEDKIKKIEQKLLKN